MILIVITNILCLFVAIIMGVILTKKTTYSQPIYQEGPQWHQAKSGTPTMGGLIFVIPVLVSTIINYILTKDIFYLIFFITMILTFLMGFMDDFGKVRHKDNTQGLSSRQKLICQFIIALIYIAYTIVTHNFSWLAIGGGVLLIPIIMGLINATNLTDGIDGLLGQTTLIAALPLALIAYLGGQYHLLSVIMVFMCSLAIFLVYNHYPAKIFMGDTGSLFIGAFLPIISLHLDLGWLTLVLMALYIFEMFSVIIQVTYFRYTKKTTGEGKRIFLMAPFHHHLEKKGLSENRIVQIFSLVQVLLSTLVFIIYYA